MGRTFRKTESKMPERRAPKGHRRRTLRARRRPNDGHACLPRSVQTAQAGASGSGSAGDPNVRRLDAGPRANDRDDREPQTS